jgi:hypothetical protein
MVKAAVKTADRAALALRTESRDRSAYRQKTPEAGGEERPVVTATLQDNRATTSLRACAAAALLSTLCHPRVLRSCGDAAGRHLSHRLLGPLAGPPLRLIDGQVVWMGERHTAGDVRNGLSEEGSQAVE